MRRFLAKIFSFFGTVLLCAPLVAPASAQYLTADEIKRLFAGTRVETYFWDIDLVGQVEHLTNTPGDLPLRIYLKPDGTLEGIVEFLSTESNVGKWWTEKNDVFCFQWENLEGGDKQCARLALQKDGITIERSRPDGKKFV